MLRITLTLLVVVRPTSRGGIFALGSADPGFLRVYSVVVRPWPGTFRSISARTGRMNENR